MTDPSGTIKKLIEENAFLKMEIQELEQVGSERKQLKEALRKSEENYRTLIQKIQTARRQLYSGQA